MPRRDLLSNTIGDGIFFSAVIQGRDVTVQLPAQVPSALSGLPAGSPAFAGRADELAELLAALTPGPPAGPGPEQGAPTCPAAVLVCGLAGVGKTELAVQAAGAALARGWFSGGVLFADLLGYDDTHGMNAGRALDGFLRALGVPAEHIPPAQADRRRLYASVLATYAAHGRPILVVLDNARTHDQALPLLPPAGAVIVTSRDTLAMLPARLLDLDILSPPAALDMLARAVAVGRPGDTRVAADPAAAGEVAALCGRLPLALQIIAALLAEDPARPLAAMACDLADERSRLDEMRYDHREVRTALDLSYRHLAPSAARLFRLLALNPGPDIATAAAAVLAEPDPTAVADVLRAVLDGPEPARVSTLAAWIEPRRAGTRRTLEALARAHLVERGAQYGRWRMHDLVRLFADEQGRTRATDDNRPQLQTLLLGYYCATAWAAAAHLDEVVVQPTRWGIGTRGEALAWLDAEYANLIAAADAAARGDLAGVRVTLNLRLALFHHTVLRRRFDDALAVFGPTAVRAARRLGDRRGEAVVLRNQGGALLGLGRLPEAVAALTDAVAIFREIGDRHGEGTVLTNLGGTYSRLGRHDEAIDTLRDAVRIHQEHGIPHGHGIALNNLGIALLEAGRTREAVAELKRSVRLLRRARNPAARANAMTNLAAAICSEGRFAEAAALFESAAAIFREAGDRDREGHALNGLGSALTRLDRIEEALSALREAQEIHRETGNRASEGINLILRGDALRRSGRAEEAVEALAAAAPLVPGDTVAELLRDLQYPAGGQPESGR